MAKTLVHDEAEEPSIVERLVLEAEIQAERLIGWVRIGLSAWLFVVLLLSFVAVELLDIDMRPIREMVRHVGIPTQIVFLLIGLSALYVSRADRWRPWMAYCFTTADALLVGLAVFQTLRQSGLDGSFVAAAPPTAALPLLLCIGVLRPRPWVQYYAVGLNILLLLAIVFWIGGLGEAMEDKAVASLPTLFALPANSLRFALLVATGLIVALGAAQTRALLKRSVRESQRRKALTRFLPAEIAPLVANERFGAMRRGQRRVATVMFVDIRDSTARAETLDPERLSIFISAFRRRVMRAVEAHHGIVDKFIGDGALVLFGVQEADGNGAADALACAKDLLDLVERWNAKRRFPTPVRVGIGIHTGEVYVGVVGDEHRLEFTVLGDTVNVAARMEQLTKVVGSPLLASSATLEAAGTAEGWEILHDEPLRGRVARLPVLAPQGGARWPLGLPPADSQPG